MDSLTLTRSRVFSTGRRGVEVEGTNTTITHSLFQEIRQGMELWGGDNLHFAYNVVKVTNRTNSCLILDEGEGHDIQWNLFERCHFGFLSDRTSNSYFKRNVLRSLSNTGIRIDGDGELVTNWRIENNVIKDAAEKGIHLTEVSDSTIKGNTMENLGDDGMDIRGDFNTPAQNMKILKNVIKRVGRDGMFFSGENSLIQGNLFEYAGIEDGIHLSGGSNKVLDNIVRYSGEIGIKNGSPGNNTPFSNNNVYRGNRSEYNGSSGFLNGKGNDNTVDHNTFLKNNGEGINNLGQGTNTLFTNNTSLQNRTDICNDGSINPASDDNRFDTGGFNTPCVVEQ